MIIAVLHILGAIFVLFLIFIIPGVLFEVKWGIKRSDEILECAAIEMGLPKEEVFSGKYNPEISRYLLERYSANKFANRLSDMFRPILITIQVLGCAAQLGLIVLVIWFSFTESLEFSKSAWFAVPIALLFLILHRGLFWLCYLSTGRPAGEAKQVRKLALNLIE